MSSSSTVSTSIDQFMIGETSSSHKQHEASYNNLLTMTKENRAQVSSAIRLLERRKKAKAVSRPTKTVADDDESLIQQALAQLRTVDRQHEIRIAQLERSLKQLRQDYQENLEDAVMAELLRIAEVAPETVTAEQLAETIVRRPPPHKQLLQQIRAGKTLKPTPALKKMDFTPQQRLAAETFEAIRQRRKFIASDS